MLVISVQFLLIQQKYWLRAMIMKIKCTQFNGKSNVTNSKFNVTNYNNSTISHIRSLEALVQHISVLVITCIILFAVVLVFSTSSSASWVC